MQPLIRANCLGCMPVADLPDGLVGRNRGKAATAYRLVALPVL